MKKSQFISIFKRGWKQLCPQCGVGKLYRAYLKVEEKCTTCGLDFEDIRSDDAPAYFTIAIVGHIILPLIYYIELAYSPTLLTHFIIWVPVITLTILFFLPRVKAIVMALIWLTKKDV